MIVKYFFIIKLRDGIPDNGEKVKTPDGMGKVFDTNILEETVRVRLFTGELDENGNEKLETDLKVYSKQEIQRTKKSKHINKNNNGCESCNTCQKSSEEGIDE